MTGWVTVIDISEHQGAGDFTVTKARGVKGLIIRATHGQAIDALIRDHYQRATFDGYEPHDIGFFEFCNPKRGTPVQCAEQFVNAVTLVRGDTDTFFMLDIESYINETPKRGTALSPQAYSDWLVEHINILSTECAPGRIVGYTNNSYYSKGVGSQTVAQMIPDWIGARYPCNTPTCYASHPLPMDPAQWDEWAFSLSTGPVMPAGCAGWEGWQFSAGYNGQGRPYGFQSDNLDLDIIRPDAWARWTNTPLPPSPGDDMKDSVLLVRDSRHTWATDWLEIREVSAATIDLLVFLGHTPKNPDGSPLIVPVADGIVDEILDRRKYTYPPVAVPPMTLPVQDVRLDVPSVPGVATGTVTPR